MLRIVLMEDKNIQTETPTQSHRPKELDESVSQSAFEKKKRIPISRTER